jgi:hypothetical protein
MKEGTGAKEQEPQILFPSDKFNLESFSSVSSLSSLSSTLFEKTFLDQIKQAQKADMFIKKILPFLLDIDAPHSPEMLAKTLDYSIQSDLVCFNNLLYVPNLAELCLSILKSVHDSTSSGHFGQTRTFDMLTRH